MTQDKLREVLAAAAEKSDVLRLLRESPSELARQFDLDPEEILALRRADLLFIRLERNPLANAGTTTYTFDTGSTIGGTTTYTFDTGSTIAVGPSRLEDLDKDHLIQVLRRALTDTDYSRQLRDFLKL
jgi:hypothetical protein